MDAYDNLGDIQIAVEKAANAEVFCVESLPCKVGSSKRKMYGLVAAMEESIERQITVFSAQVPIYLGTHGASSHGSSGKNAAGKSRLVALNTITSAPTILQILRL